MHVRDVTYIVWRKDAFEKKRKFDNYLLYLYKMSSKIIICFKNASGLLCFSCMNTKSHTTVDRIQLFTAMQRFITRVYRESRRDDSRTTTCMHACQAKLR